MGTSASMKRLLQTPREPFFDDPDRACADADPELFFPEAGDKRQAATAKEVCARCPVLSDCRTWALGVTGLAGIWGGTSQSEREKWRSKRRARRGSGS
jgi:WhiB family transcriptional regulator, redox-sensing transcriptional regulator